MSSLMDRIEATVSAVAAGAFDARVVPIGPGDGTEERIAHGLNRILDLVDATLKEAQGSASAAAAGHYARRPILRGVPGDARRTLQSIDRTIGMLEQQAGSIAAQRARQAEASHAFNQQVAQLLGSVSEAAVHLADAMDGLEGDFSASADAMTELASEVRSVDEHLGSVATTTTQLHATASAIGTRAADAASLVGRSRQDGGEAIARVRELEGTFGELKRSLSFIDGIAEETRMLALNATIEAAHAGAAGRGFAVVASEVKALAHQTTRAMGEISESVDNVDIATRQSAGGMDAVVQALGEIGQASTGVADAVREQRDAVVELDRRTIAVRSASQRMAGRASHLHGEMLRARKTVESLRARAQGLSGEAQALGEASRRFAQVLELQPASETDTPSDG